MAVVDAVLVLACLGSFGWLVINAGRCFFEIVASRFDVPPVGMREMPAAHPEREPVELTDHERDVLMVLDVRTKWENA